MRRSTYLNVILTVNAVLLTTLLWSALAGRPLLEREAVAQTFTKPVDKEPGAQVPNIPNAAAQRADMIRALREIQGTVDSLNRTLASGRLKVEATNLDQARSN